MLFNFEDHFFSALETMIEGQKDNQKSSDGATLENHRDQNNNS